MVKKLDDNQKRDVLTMFNYKYSVRDIADKFDVSDELIRSVIQQYEFDRTGEFLTIREINKASTNYKGREGKYYSKYGFNQLKIGECSIVKGDFVKVRMLAYRCKYKWGQMFLVKDLGNGMVKIERYK